MGQRRNAIIRLTLRSVTAGFFLLAAALLLNQHWATLEWSVTLGTVTAASTAPVGDPEDSRAPGERFQPRVAYTYSVDGEDYEAETIAVFDWIFSSKQRASSYLSRYGIRQGERIPVYYDPAQPSTSIIIRSIPLRRLEVILGFVLLVLLPIGVVAFSILDVVRGGRSRSDDSSRGRMW